MLAREDFNNDQVDAGEVGAGASVTALYEITPAGGPRAVDPLRYDERNPPSPIPGTELAYLKIRYKQPGKPTSQLIERAITPQLAYQSLDKAPEATRWAVAVAAYGQKLRDEPYMAAAFTWDDVVSLAQGARGADPLGSRAEFLKLTRTAKEIRARNAGL